MKILLLASAFNGLAQRIWLDLRRRGHDVTVELSLSESAMRDAAVLVDPDLIICPFLRERVPAAVWRQWPTVIVHPGPEGDRGPSSLDWAIAGAHREWGVTVLSAVEEMDSGDVWATRTFPLPAAPPRKSALYCGVVADTAVELVRQTVERFADPGFRPWRQDRERRGLAGRTRPLMRQADRAFDWSAGAADVLRSVRAADGSPGVLTSLCGLDVRAYDAHPGSVPTAGEPGSVAARRNGAVLVRTGGGGGVWIGHLKADGGIKLPAAAVLGEQRLRAVPADTAIESYPEIAYRRSGAVGTLTVDLYNGAMSAGQAVRIANAIRHATAQDTRVLVLRGGDAFCTGINLNVIEAAADPVGESWRSILAIDEVCRLLLTATSQLVVAAVAGDAGAGGAMLALTADRVLVRTGAVLNPHYRTMGLHGSEYWTYTLPRRVGRAAAERLTTECLPIGSAEAVSLGFADAELAADRGAFDVEVAQCAAELAGRDVHARLLAAKRERLDADGRRRPLDAYLAQELGEMARDFFDDSHGYAAARTAFVTKRRPAATPLRLAHHRVALPLARTAPHARPTSATPTLAAPTNSSPTNGVPTTAVPTHDISARAAG